MVRSFSATGVEADLTVGQGSSGNAPTSTSGHISSNSSSSNNRRRSSSSSAVGVSDTHEDKVMRAVRTVRQQDEAHSEFRPLCLLLKVMLHQQGLDKPFTGGLG